MTRKQFAAAGAVVAALVLMLALVAQPGAGVRAAADTASTPALSQTSWAAKLTCTASSSGYCTVSHPAGVIPDAVTVTPLAPAIVSVDQLTAATLRIRFARAIAANGTVTANPAGLGYCAYGGGTNGKPCSGDPANATFIVFTDNVFQRGGNGKCGTWGPITDFITGRNGNVWSGNTWDNGAPVVAG